MGKNRTLNCINLLKLLFLAILILSPLNSFAEDGDISNIPDPLEENSSIETVKGNPIWADLLLWVPNRLMDIVDIFKIDVGIGPAFGAVARITDNAQIGYRQMLPLSVRGGIAGRSSPFFVESGVDIGVSPVFRNSQGRKVCPGEVGVGADLLIVGGYGGICVDEVVDFLGGIIFLDPLDDDLK